MPYTLKGNCVIRADTGAVVKCHPSREAARKHLIALKINVERKEGVGMSALGRLANKLLRMTR